MLVIIAFCASAIAKEPVHILPIGDSITQGGRAGVKEYTYRWPLSKMLNDEGACFDFIGSHHSGLDAQAQWPQGWDADNEGYYGAKTATVRDKLSQTLPFLPKPDLALIHLGTNDGDGSVNRDIVEPLRQMVTMLRKSSPNVVVLLAQIPVGYLRAVYLHYRMTQLALELTNPTSPVLVVDQYSDWDMNADTFDGVHPNLVGQRKMAEHWLAAMRPYLRLSASDGC